MITPPFFFASGTPLDDAHEVGLLHDQELLAIEFHFGPGPFPEQNPIAVLHHQRDDLTFFISSAWAGGDDFAFHRLFLDRVGDDDAAGRLLFGGEAAHHHPIVQGSEFHEICSIIGDCQATSPRPVK